MDQNLEQMDQPPGPRPTLPALSPPFATADDAARWAHARIGSYQQVEYGGVILKREGRFFATRPIAGNERFFLYSSMLQTTGDYGYLPPPGYRFDAFYHSHPDDTDEVTRANPGLGPEYVKLHISFFSHQDQNVIIRQRSLARAHYLSGPHGSLLKYMPSGSAAEQEWLKRISGELPIEQVNEFEGTFWPLAEAGDLRVVIANKQWGGRPGRISKGWRLFDAATVMKDEQPPYTQVFERAEWALTAALAMSPAGSIQGFLLKHVRSEGYVASYPEALGTPLFSAAARFPARNGGALRLPSNFRLEAIYYRSTPQAADIPVREPWLYATFFTPAEVAAAIAQARATQAVQDNARGLKLYQWASDGALLQLDLPGEATNLAREPQDAAVDDNGAQAALLAGTLTARNYLRRVIAATTVSVVQAGSLWRTAGPVYDSSAILNSFHQAVLSPPFLSALDAAVFAHEQIGARRKHAYGGYILKGEDGRFLITLPEASEANPFAQLLFAPADGLGPIIPPEAFEICGRYGSHPALSMIDPAWIEQRGWTREDTEVNAQIFSAEELHALIPQKRPAYLSGSHDCLLAYTPSGSAKEALLLASTAPQSGGSTAQRRLDSREIKPEQWVRQVAQAGDLRVIQGNALWGPRDPVSRDWTPNFVYAERSGPPGFITYGAIFATADQAARNLHSRVHGSNREAESCYAFILKHVKHEQYIATQVVDVDARFKLFAREALFKRTNAGYVFPDGFKPCALFRSQQWQPTGLSSANTWLTRFFVLPAVMYAALYDARRWGDLYNAGQNLSLYFSTEEGALLRYRMPGPFALGGGPLERDLESMQAALLSGIKRPLDFVQETARRGQLDVLRTSQCWDIRGPAKPGVQCYARLVRRRLTPSFANPDDAVRHVRRLIGIGRQRAYGGVLLRLGNGLFCATEPLAVPPQGFALNWIYPDQAVAKGLYPETATIVARYRSVVAREVPFVLSATQKAIYIGMVPTGVLSNLLRREVHIKREYLLGPAGSVVSYSLTNSPEEQRLSGDLAALNLVKGDVEDNLIERQLRTGALLPADLVTRVAKGGELRVVEGSDAWGPPRRVIGDFAPFTYRWPAQLIRSALADPAFGPIFTQADDAVRSVSPGAAMRAGLSFGYLLKSTKKNHYQVTRPLQRQDYSRLVQVFHDALLPYGYAIAGLYLCASNAAIAKADDPMVQSFFSPPDIADGLRFVKKSANGGYWPLYLLCADNAWLKFRFDGRNPSLTFPGEAASLRRRLLEGSLKVVDYVRSLSITGALDVLESSAVWASRGRITNGWQPRAEALEIQGAPQMSCGPVFAHADDAARHSKQGFTGKTFLSAILQVAGTRDVCALTPVQELESTQVTAEALFQLGGGIALTSSYLPDYYTVVAVQSFYKAMAPLVGAEAFDTALRANFIDEADLKVLLATLRTNEPTGVSCYLTGRGGGVLKYQPINPSGEDMLSEIAPKRSAAQLISKLRQLGQLSVLETDAFWTLTGVLGDEWQVKDVQVEPDPDSLVYGRDKDEL
jgi:hypothetical protein